jgi:hypothetical protein
VDMLREAQIGTTISRSSENYCIKQAWTLFGSCE